MSATIELERHPAMAADVVNPKAVAYGPWRTVPGHPGARTRNLEPRPPDAVLGLLYLEAGTSAPARRGTGPTWIWVLKGRCRLDGRVLESGAYAWVPASDACTLDVPGFGPRGCLLLVLAADGEAGPPAS
jgi:hypothetical protein